MTCCSEMSTTPLFSRQLLACIRDLSNEYMPVTVFLIKDFEFYSQSEHHQSNNDHLATVDWTVTAPDRDFVLLRQRKV